MGSWATECGWRHAPEVLGEFWGFWKSQLVELSPASGEDGWLSLARGGLGQVSHEMGGRWKSQNRKNVYLSPYIEEPLNWKVIKSFVPELRSRKCFSCFDIPMFYVYILWTLYVLFTLSRIWMLHSDYSLHLCYFHKVSADMSSGLLQVFVELGEPSRNFELRPLLNPQGSPVLIPLAMTGYKC